MILTGGIKDPKDIVECAAWWDFNNVESLTLVGGNISIANDLSGNSWNLSQSTSSSRPVSTTVNGRNVASFSSDALTLGTNSLTQGVPGITFIAVGATSTPNNTQRYLISSTASDIQRYGLHIGEFAGGAPGGNTFTTGGRRLDSDSFMGIGGGTVTTNSFIHIAACDFPNGTLACYVNGERVAYSDMYHTGDTSTNIASPNLTLGGIPAGAAVAYSGYIGEVIIFSRTLSNAERRSIEWYLSKKWSINVV